MNVRKITSTLLCCVLSCAAFARPGVLAKAAMDNDTARVIKLLEKRGDPNDRGEARATALMFAAQNDNLELVKALLAAGADPKATRDGEIGAVHHAVASAGVAVVDALLAAGVPVDTRTGKGATALGIAISAGRFDLVGPLMERGADLKATAAYEEALMWALSAKGRDRRPAPILTRAVAEQLVAAGADPAKTPALKTVPQGGVTALLFLAANSHQSDAIPWLVARGADVNVVDSKGTTPLVMACAGTQFEVTFNGLSVMGSFLAGPNKKAPDGRIVAKSLLLAKDTMPDLQSLGFDDAKGRLAEISARRAATLTALIAAGADVVKADAEGTTALSKLAHTFDATSVGVLIAAGADPLRAAENKQPPLHAAAQAGVTETLLAMLAAKPDVNAANAKQQTPLMLAAHAGGDVETVIELLKAGADVAARDGLGNTPLHYAVGAEEWLLSRNASNELAPLVAKVLIAARADVNARNAAGKTPGDLAAGNAKYSASAAVLQDAEKQSRR